MNEKELDSYRYAMVYWMEKYDHLMKMYQTLVHENEELKNALRSGHRDGQEGIEDLASGNED